VKSQSHPIDIISRALPGIGICQELELRSGRRIGIVTRRDGLRDLVIYGAEDPDATTDHVELSDEEADAIAEILGAPQLVVQLAGLQKQSSGLLVEQIEVAAKSPFAGRTLGDTQVRSRTGASIVAVIRQGEPIASPAPDFGLQAGDLVVVVGTKDAMDQVGAILDGSTG
jgi:TrkA domain protein